VPALAGFPPGSLVDFRIKALTPEIVLAPLGPAPGGPAALAAAAAASSPPRGLRGRPGPLLHRGGTP
jgi:hypothetical protein